jgi:hypothetical protein
MNNLIKEIENAIESAIGGFAQRVADKYSLNIDELMKLWTGGEEETKVEPKKAVTKKQPPRKVNAKKVDGCPYMFTKGTREGETCGNNPKSGATYCSRHFKYEGTEPKQKKILPTVKKSISANVAKPKVTTRKTVNAVLRKNKTLDKYWHSDTGMVFQSAKDRIVIGKCVDDELIALTPDDIEVCMAHSFKMEEPEEEVPEEEEVVPEEEEVVPEEEEVVPEEEEVVPEEEEVVPEEEVGNKAARQITAVPKKVSVKKQISRPPPAKITPKKSLAGVKAKKIKKSIAAAIAETDIQAADVEEILGELQTSEDDDELMEEEIFEEEEVPEEEGENFEEFEEEELEDEE